MTLPEKYIGNAPPPQPPTDHVHKPEFCWWCQNLRKALNAQ